MSRKYHWFCIPATREKIKRRTKDGIAVTISTDLKEVSARKLSKEIMKITLKQNSKKCKVITMFSQNIEESLEHIFEEIEEKEKRYLVAGGDLNAKTRCEGGPIEAEDTKDEPARKSRDKIINKEKQTLIEKIKARGWMIVNGSYSNIGEWTYYILAK